MWRAAARKSVFRQTPVPSSPFQSKVCAARTSAALLLPPPRPFTCPFDDMFKAGQPNPYDDVVGEF